MGVKNGNTCRSFLSLDIFTDHRTHAKAVWTFAEIWQTNHLCGHTNIVALFAKQ
jgi:hypothetical protein